MEKNDIRHNTSRNFTRREIAQFYFPSVSAEGAVKRMYRWMKDDPDLVRDLRAAGYHQKQRNFTREQVDVFIKYFGA